MPPYISNRIGFLSSADHYASLVAINQHGYLTSAHSHYPFGQPYPHHAYAVPVIPQVDGSFESPYAYHAPALPASAFVFHCQYIPAEAAEIIVQPPASTQHVRVEANEFIPGAYVHHFRATL
jgi:hypothetical protein